jgi:hypothetical protein
MPDPENVHYLLEKAQEADRRAATEHDTEGRLAWLRIAVFWLLLAERLLAETAERKSPFQFH